MEGLVKKGLLRARTAVNEWVIPDNEDEPMPPDGYVISFVRGLLRTSGTLSYGGTSSPSPYTRG
jgi:hypothetical protein